MQQLTTAGSDSGADSKLAPPTVAGKYRILDQIGQGAMGTVYRAHDPALDRIVAVKTIADRQAIDASASERFRREARLAASLNHPNIVTVFDFGEDQRGFYMVMELLEGADLASVLIRRQLETFEQKLEVIEQIADGVAFAHDQGLVHRDLKPANVHRAHDGRVKILDFGLARSNEPCLTTVGSVLGTPRYMAPEQVRGEPVDARSDVFALGAMFYEILAEKRCFPAASVHAAIFQVLERQPLPPRSLDPSLPPLVDRIVAKALAKRPERRYQTAGELRAAVAWLRRVIDGESSQSQAARALAPAAAASGADSDGLASGSTPPPAALSTPAPEPVRKPAGPACLTFVGEPGGDRQLMIPSPERKSLLDLSLAASIPHFHECGGRARCSTCRVRVIAGQDGLAPRNRLERQLAARLGWGDDIRLACQTRLVGDAAVKRLIRDSDDFGLLRFESRQEPPREQALASLACSVKNFTDFAHRSAPYDVVHISNRFFLQAGEPVLASGGKIERYAGLGLVAYFGDGAARDNCLAAVRAALRMLARLEDLNDYMESHFQTRLEVGIGLSFGRAIVGRIGHPSRQRLTVIGDAPRRATWLSRLPSDPASPILATEDLVNVVEGDVEIAGVSSEPAPDGRDVTLYEILDFSKPDAVAVAQSTFEQVAGRKQEAAELFYRLLFEIDPSTRPLFAGVDMATQGGMLMDVLALVVRGLDRLDELVPVIEDLGRRHAGYGVEVRHYDAVEQALLETLRQLLGSAFSIDVKLAWSRVYNQLAKIMIEAAEAAEAASPAAVSAARTAPGVETAQREVGAPSAVSSALNRSRVDESPVSSSAFS